jgi:hypothetical protein
MDIMTDAQPDEKVNLQINKMFDLAEKPIMEYISYALKSDPREIFQFPEDLNLKTDELILMPLEEVGNYLCFKLEVVTYDYENTIPAELLENKDIKGSLKFLDHSVQEVYNAITAKSLSEAGLTKSFAASFHFEFDENDVSFKPIYVYHTRRQVNIFEKCKKELQDFYEAHQQNNTWEDVDEKVQTQWNSHYGQIISALENMHYDEATADKKEEEMKEYLKNSHKLAVVFREADKSEFTNIILK